MRHNSNNHIEEDKMKQVADTIHCPLIKRNRIRGSTLWCGILSFYLLFPTSPIIPSCLFYKCGTCINFIVWIMNWFLCLFAARHGYDMSGLYIYNLGVWCYIFILFHITFILREPSFLLLYSALFLTRSAVDHLYYRYLSRCLLSG